MKWTFRRRTGGLPARSLVGSLLVHGAVGVLALLAGMSAPEPLNFITFEVEIVSPPPLPDQEEPSTPDELVVERPEEAPEEETVDEVPLPEAEPEPEPEPEQPQPERQPDPEPERQPEPEEEGELSGEDIEVRMEGVRRDFPEYYGNIILQIQRCFRPPPNTPGNLRTTVYFVIRQDGSVADLRFVEQSGNPDFDFEALGAVGDCAGRSGRFGPLPEDLPYERLPILFEFRPPGDGTTEP